MKCVWNWKDYLVSSDAQDGASLQVSGILRNSCSNFQWRHSLSALTFSWPVKPSEPMNKGREVTSFVQHLRVRTRWKINRAPANSMPLRGTRCWREFCCSNARRFLVEPLGRASTHWIGSQGLSPHFDAFFRETGNWERGKVRKAMGKRWRIAPGS